MAKNLPPKAAQAEAAMQKLSAAKHDAGEIDRDLAFAKADLSKWNAARMNVSLYAARKELADRQADEARAVGAAQDASSELDKTKADLAAAEKVLADAPARIKAKEDAIAQAHQAMDKANAAVAAANDVVTHKQALIQPATDFSANIATEAGKAPDDATLKDAATKAKETLDLLNHDLATARQTVDARNAEAKQAADASAAADKALAQAKSDADAAPALIATLRAKVDEVTTRTADARATATKLAEEAHKPVVDAQQKVDALTREYVVLIHAAQEQSAAVLELTRK